MSDKRKVTAEVAETTTLVPIRHSWSSVSSLAEAVQIAELIAKANALPDIRNAGVALLKIMAGGELGFGPFASLTGVHIIEGKPSVGSHLIAAAIRRSEKYDYGIVVRDGVEQNNDGVCEVEFFERMGSKGGLTRKGTDGWQSVGKLRYTIEEARAKGWHLTQKGGEKGPWIKTPRNMLFARVIVDGYKTYCPDLIGGSLVYDPDELDSPAVIVTTAAALPATASLPAVDVEPELEGNAGMPCVVPEPLVEKFSTLVREMNLSGSAVVARLQQTYGVDSFRKLTVEQAEEVTAKLETAALARRAG